MIDAWIFAPAGADVLALSAELDAMERVRTDGIVPLPGAAELLQSLPGSAVALVTSADRILADIRMGAAGLAMPAAAVTADLVTRGKPHPEGYLRWPNCSASSQRMPWSSRMRLRGLRQPWLPECARWR
jgi:beta-phosphoglucomutase-like phosphatase (HAD superfamily)